MKFEDTGLKPEIIKGVKKLGFEAPMPIQEKVISAMLNQRPDLIAIAQTGTGKTAAYGLPLVHLIDPKLKEVQALILTPTRELCIQVAEDISSFARYSEAIEVLPIYGGASIENQIRGLKKSIQLVVGTPGRLRDLIKRKKLNIKEINTLVLDEADEMLSMGFKEDLNAILKETPENRQTLLFSATMPREIAELADDYMNDPIEIAVGRKNIGAETVDHHFYMVNASDRYQALKRIADFNPDIYGIVFCRTRKETKEVAEKLIGDGYNADALHGDLSQAQRDHVMNRFRIKNLQMLVATDVAARGLDVDELTHIINYNLPDESETYIHRSGRTGRAGKKGICITIIHRREQGKIKMIEKKIKKAIKQQLVPSGTEICERQIFKLIDKLETVSVDEEPIKPYLPAIYEKLSSLSREELIQHFVSLEFSRHLEYYKNAPDLNILQNEKKGKKKKKKLKASYHQEFSRFFINSGSQDGLEPAHLIGLINEQTRKRDIDIGRIEIMKKFSFFEVDIDYTDRVLKGFESAEWGGRKIVVELAQEKKEYGASRKNKDYGTSKRKPSRKNKETGSTKRTTEKKKAKKKSKKPYQTK